MTTASDLKKALKHILCQNGVLSKIEAQAKAEIFSALTIGTAESQTSSRQKFDEDGFIINELILEYFKFNGLQFSESVFRSEIGHYHEQISRRLLCQSLNVKPTVSAKFSDKESISSSEVIQSVDKPVPLLYYFVEYFKSNNPSDK